MSVEIHVTAGPTRGQSFVFEKPGHLIFGRATTAHISVPHDQYVSRQHFELEIDPPNCMLRDLNSTNGVFVNGVHYGGRASRQAAGQESSRSEKEVSLKDGDEIAVRDTRIKISIRTTPKEETSTGILVPPKNTLVANREIALFVLSVPQSPQRIPDTVETQLSELIGSILTKVKRHTASSELLFLKYMGDGFLMAFPTVNNALSLAFMLLNTPGHFGMPIRMALHWGTVKTRPNGDVIGREVHRVYRFEGVQRQDRIDSEVSGHELPVENRILISKEGLEQLSDEDRAQFKLAGSFRLKGFDEGCELWFVG